MYPAIDRAPIDHGATFGKPLRDIGVAQAIADVPPDGKSDHLIGEAMVRESARRARREASAAFNATPTLTPEPGVPVSPCGHALTANAPHVVAPFVEPTVVG